MKENEAPARMPGRRITSDRVEFRRLAENTTVGGVTRGQLRILVEDLVSTGIITSSESHLLAVLINTAPKESFGRGGQPIVYKSNRALAFEVNKSEGRVSRTLSKLFDLGLIAMQDSANYKRYPVRNEHGAIVSGCGVDLRVMIHRYDELRLSVEKCRAEQRLAVAAGHRYRSAVRELHALIEMGSDIAPRLRRMAARRLERLQAMIGSVKRAYSGRLERATNVIQWLTDRLMGLSRKSTADESPINSENETSVHAVFDTHIQNTTSQKTSNCNDERRSATAELVRLFSAGYASDSALEKEGGGAKAVPERRLPSLPALQSVIEACPALKDWTGHEPRNWGELGGAAALLAKMYGISEHARASAVKIMGADAAAVAICLTVARTEREEVKSAGGFLRALTDRAVHGELYLARSIHALVLKKMAVPA